MDEIIKNDSLEEYEIIKENYCSSPKCGIKSKIVSSSVEKLILIPREINSHRYFKYSVTPIKPDLIYKYDFSQNDIMKNRNIEGKSEKTFKNFLKDFKNEKHENDVEKKNNESNFFGEKSYKNKKSKKTSQKNVNNLLLLSNNKTSSKKTDLFFNPLRTATKNNLKNVKIKLYKSKGGKEPKKITQSVTSTLLDRIKTQRKSNEIIYQDEYILNQRKKDISRKNDKTMKMISIKFNESSDNNNRFKFFRRSSHFFSVQPRISLQKNNNFNEIPKIERSKRKGTVDTNINKDILNKKVSFKIRKDEKLRKNSKKKLKKTKKKKSKKIKDKSRIVLNNLKLMFKDSNQPLPIEENIGKTEDNLLKENKNNNYGVSNSNNLSNKNLLNIDEQNKKKKNADFIVPIKFQRSEIKHKTRIVFQSQFHVEKITQYTNKQMIKNMNEYTKQCLEIIPDLLTLDNIPRCKTKVHPNFEQNSKNIKKIALFDLDETIVHCIGEINMNNVDSFSRKNDAKIKVQLPGGKVVLIGINIRPNWEKALNLIKDKYHIVAYTASHESYADSVLNYLDPEKKIFEYRLYRSHCVLCSFNEAKFYVKDLGIFDEFCDLKNVVLIDNSVLSFSYHIDNGIPISPFYDSKTDNELVDICEFLLKIADEDDIRVKLREKYKLNELLNIIKEQKKSSSDDSSISVVQEKYDDIKSNKTILNLNETTTTINDNNDISNRIQNKRTHKNFEYPKVYKTSLINKIIIPKNRSGTNINIHSNHIKKKYFE